jgi:hypothetical protein
MEIFLDFGVFELLVFSAIGTVMVRAYRNPIVAAVCSITSIGAPGALLWLADAPLVRSIAAVALGTAVVNVFVILRIAGHRFKREGS